MAKKPTEYVNVEINDQPVQLPRDELILWSARELGYDIPHFCAHRWLEPLGACRMCLIKVEMGGRMMPKLQASCAIKPAEGMKIWTEHEEVIQARREQLEFHLINHPLECPVCDKGGECMLQDQTTAHGCFEGRYKEQKRVKSDKQLNPFIRINHKRCIHCKRCSGFTADIDGTHLLKMVDRGSENYIDSFPDPTVAPHFSGNVIDICPVGALTAINYRFVMGRPWEQELHPSVGSLDSVGSNIWLNTRLGDVARIVPRDNLAIDNGLIDDATRFSWEAIEDPRRVCRAIVKHSDGDTTVSRNAGEQAAGKALAAVLGEYGPDSVGIIAGEGLNCEEYLALRRFAGEIDTAYYMFGEDLFGGGGCDAPALASFTNDFATLDEIKHAATVLSIGCDLFAEAPSLGLQLDVRARRGQLKLLSARSHKCDADRFAAQFAGYDYGALLSFINGLTAAIDGQAEGEVGALAGQLREAGEDLVIIYGEEVWRTENTAELIHALMRLREVLARASGAQVYLNPVLPGVNSAGALMLNNLGSFTGEEPVDARPSVGSLRRVLEAAAEGQLKALLVFDSDVLAMYPDRDLARRALGRVECLAYCGPYVNSTSELAQFHLPLGSYAHREGTVVSMEWRVHKRCLASLDSSAPGVLDVLNSLAIWLEVDDAGEMIETLYGELGEIKRWPAASFEGFPEDGVLLGKQLAPAAVPAAAGTDPAAVGQGLQLIPKRFLYNDRAEIRYSPVFDGVAKPFAAYLNPADLEQLGIKDGAEVTLAGPGGELSLVASKAKWVLPGSVVVNDYYEQAPVNQLAGFEPVRVEVKVQVAASGSSEA